MAVRVPQPPVNPALRSPERHDFWLAFIVLLMGGILVICGARQATDIPTVDGGTASELQLVKAFSSGGLQYPSQVESLPPPPLDDPHATGEALERWARQQASASPPTWKVRIDTAAATPCPT